MSFRDVVIRSACVSLLASAPALAQTAAPPQPPQPPDSVRYPCRRVHDFDFWAGTFDATPWDKPDAKPRGRLHNTREYDGCVFVERWTSPRGNGMSIVFYDVTLKTWRMFWDSDSNGSNVFDRGTVTGGVMRFTGWVVDSTGTKVMAANVLERVSPNVIRHTYSESPDSGRTWRLLGTSRFTRVNPSANH